MYATYVPHPLADSKLLLSVKVLVCGTCFRPLHPSVSWVWPPEIKTFGCPGLLFVQCSVLPDTYFYSFTISFKWPLIWFLLRKSNCFVCVFPPLTETTKVLLNRGADFPPGETDMKQSHRASSCSVMGGEAEEAVRSLRGLFSSVLEMAIWDGEDTVRALFTTRDHMKWREGRCAGGGRWMFAKGQEFLCNFRAEPTAADADIWLVVLCSGEKFWSRCCCFFCLSVQQICSRHSGGSCFESSLGVNF